MTEAKQPIRFTFEAKVDVLDGTVENQARDQALALCPDTNATVCIEIGVWQQERRGPWRAQVDCEAYLAEDA